MAEPSVSVVLLTARRIPFLLDCLQSIAEGSLAPAEAVVVLTDPADGTREALAGWQGPFALRLIEAPAGSGYAEARNAGAAAAQGELIASIDDDCLADRHWLRRLVEALREADAVGGGLLPAEELPSPPDLTPDQAWLAGLYPPDFWGPLGGRVALPTTANLAFRKAVWERHPFQEIGARFGQSGGADYDAGREDAQFWRALRRAGLRAELAPRALVWHRIPKDRLRFSVMADRAERDGRAHWRREHPREDLAAAASDLAQAPLRLARDLFDPALTSGQALRRHKIWTRRQAAFLGAAVDDFGPDGISPPKRLALLLREGRNGLLGHAKAALRPAAARAFHALRQPRPVPSPADPPRRALVVCYNWLGDAVLTLPMIGQLKKAFPACEVSVLCGPTAAEIYRGAPGADQVVELPRGLTGRRPRHIRAVAEAVARARPDVIVVTYFHQAPPLGLYTATDAPVICWNRENGFAQQYATDFAAVRVHKLEGKAEAASLLNLLAPMGVAPVPQRPRLAIPRDAQARADALLERCGLAGRPFAAIHADDPARFKSWPTERWAALARWLIEEKDLPVVFTDMREQRGEFEAMNLPPDGAFGLHGLLKPLELGAIHRRARVCLGTDSGPQHIAQAVGAPTVILFGPSDDRVWGPQPRLPGEDHAPPFRVVRGAPWDWLPEETRGFAINEHMLRITVEQVKAAVEELLSASGGEVVNR
ncbi:MAG: glycosyltransferase family 9 protein [Sumerlaeia bacterium]